jgi:hypothetical protein
MQLIHDSVIFLPTALEVPSHQSYPGAETHPDRRQNPNMLANDFTVRADLHIVC